MMKYDRILKYYIFSWASLLIYISGLAILSYIQNTPYSSLAVFWIEILYSPAWIKVISALTIFAGTMLIYFFPGAVIARQFSPEDSDLVDIFSRGFLINYFVYYLSIIVYKVISGNMITRGAFISLVAGFLLISGVIVLTKKSKATGQINQQGAGGFRVSKFTVFYVILILIIFLLFWKKIFIAPFTSDGAEQFWLAQSLKSEVLPTFYRIMPDLSTPATLIPQFPFSPSLYLNTFALLLFGDSEFIMRLEVLLAFICLGFLLKALLVKIRKPRIQAFEYLPLFLYLFIFFIIIAYRSFYHLPTGLAKSNETLQLAMFLAGLYFLIRSRYLYCAIFLILASMIRYNGFLMILVFLVTYSFLFKTFRPLLIYSLGVFSLLASLFIVVSFKQYSLPEMWTAFRRDLGGCYYFRNDLSFLGQYLKNFLFFTAGLSIPMFLYFKNKYIRLFSLVTIIYLFLPVKSHCVPAHFFVPILLFPIIGFYLYDIKWRNLFTLAVILLEILTIVWLYPKQETSQALTFRKNLSKVCINTNDLFEAAKVSVRFNQLMNFYGGTGFDSRLTMYYANLNPKYGETCAVFLGRLPPWATQKEYKLLDLPSELGSISVGRKREKVYFKGDQESFSNLIREAGEDYYAGNKPYIIERVLD